LTHGPFVTLLQQNWQGVMVKYDLKWRVRLNYRGSEDKQKEKS